MSSKNSNSGTNENIPGSIDEIKTRLDALFADCNDFYTREFTVGSQSIRVLIAYMDGLAKTDKIDKNMIKPMLTDAKTTGLSEQITNQNIIDILKNQLLHASFIEEMSDFSQVTDRVLTGDTAVFADGNSKVLIADTVGFEMRSIEQPDTDVVVRGPREGFTEVLDTNIAMIRRKIRNADLKFETIKLGKRTKTDVCIAYIKNLASDKIIQTVKRRLKQINIDVILESGYIEEYIEDAPFSIFPTVGNTEKPDIAAAKILEGRVAILCNGTPFALTVPYLFIESIQASEDYYARPFFSTFLRWLRVLTLIISTIVPALYVALTNFHQDMIPTELMIRISASREGLPLSSFMEAMAMVVTFEVLREAGVRMPKSVGQAVNIVGALIIGQAAVDAGLVSDIMVIVIAVTAISSFLVIPMVGTTTLIRIALLICANILGLMGIGLGLTAVFAHACSLRSFEVPYMSPISPIMPTDLKDTFVRVPLWAMMRRPKAIKPKDQFRRGSDSFRKKGEQP